MRQKGSKRVWYVCKNTPTHPGHIQQSDHLIKNKATNIETKFPDRYEFRVLNLLQDMWNILITPLNN